jgi:hypothetical protein
MNSKSNQRQTTPKFLVYTKAPDGKSCQAAWYDESVEATAKIYGQRQGFKVLEIRPDQVNQVKAALDEGAPAAKGELTLHAVKPEVLDRLLATLSAAPPGGQTGATKVPPAVPTEPANAKSNAAASLPPIDSLWAALTVNMVVLAPELTDGVPEGWWEVVITAIQGDMVTVRYRDYPEYAPFRRRRDQLAIMYPPPARA